MQCYLSQRLMLQLSSVTPGPPPQILRFFYGRLAPIGGWQEALAAKFRADFGDAI